MSDKVYAIKKGRKTVAIAVGLAERDEMLRIHANDWSDDWYAHACANGHSPHVASVEGAERVSRMVERSIERFAPTAERLG